MATPKTIRTLKVNGHTREAVNSLSSGPGCEPHTYILRTSAPSRYTEIRKTPIGWVIEDGSTFIPELGIFATRITVEF